MSITRLVNRLFVDFATQKPPAPYVARCDPARLAPQFSVRPAVLKQQSVCHVSRKQTGELVTGAARILLIYEERDELLELSLY